MKETSGIRLSFCIPTLNRGSFIGETLGSIISQSTGEVEIVVVDGGSTDNTEEIVREYQLRFPRLRYIREHPQEAGLPVPAPSGGGFDRDCNRAVELAQGEYCWLFADDDLMMPGAIGTILDAIQLPYHLIVVNAEVRTPDLSRMLLPRLLRMNADRVYKPSEHELLFTDVGNYLSFVGGVVIKRDLWVARDREKYFGSLFVHVGVIFQSRIAENTLVISKPLISIRYGNAIWGPKRFEISMFKWPDLIWSFPAYPDSAKRQVYPKEPWRKMKTLLLLRAEGAFSLKEYSDWLEPRLGSKWARLATKLIARFPGSVLNLLGIIYCSVIHRGSGTLQVDLVNSPFYFGDSVKRLLSRSK